MARNLEKHITIIDPEKAHDSVPLNRLWDIMSEKGVNDINQQVVKNLYTNIILI